jgi:hypothetical protein
MTNIKQRLRDISSNANREVTYAAIAEIERLEKIVDGTGRREAGYLALVEQHAEENKRLQKTLQDNNHAHDVIYEQQLAEIGRLMDERHTTKQMLRDILDKHIPKKPVD